MKGTFTKKTYVKYYAGLSCAILLWMSSPVMAADNGEYQSVLTKEVIVEADKAKEEAKYESQNTTIITKKDIEKKQAKSIEDIIFSETGVTRTVDAMGRVGISIRGADPRHTLMLVDGQPVISDVSKYMGGSDEAMRIGTENIERIEIIRGAATAKYGPDAIGGVVNIITKKPDNTPHFQINAEARYHKHDGTSENKNTWPSNYYMRADTGKIGNAKFSIFGSKRDIMPVYSNERSYKKGETWYFENFRPSLRYYGDIKNIGVTGEVEFNKNNRISFRIMSEKEDMQRRNKSASYGINSLFEPMQIFKRNMDRDTYSISYTGKNGTSDWQVDVNYGKMKENDITKTTYYGSGHDQYGGKNTLAALDWLEHKQLDVKATINTAVNDRHLLTYGMGYTDERADGTRLRNAPKQWVKSIDPWDYDKSLWVPTGKTDPDSNIHNYLFKQNENGLVWDKATEYYGGEAPIFTAEDAAAIKRIVPYMQFFGAKAISMDLTPYGINWVGNTEILERYNQFNEELKKSNDLSKSPLFYRTNPVIGYYGLFDTYGQDKDIKYNGKYYGENFDERENQVSGGEARILKRYTFIQDSWQVNDNTVVTPILRIDDSDLFGSHLTANLGMTHNLGGNPHRRLKINVGTGYAEPGMGELYYNWEMYGSSGGSRLGWYWIGNPNLKPEKSVNFDISLEGENNKTYSRISLFHNTIDDYMTQYFTGQLIDFNFNGNSYVLNQDRIYSFKNIGKAEITGMEAEIQQRFNTYWSAKLGYAWLHAINKSDPDMPRQLLDRPQHKVDISLNYEDKKHGGRAALWGDYYIHMLDGNSVNTNELYAQDNNGNYKRKDAQYQKKTFGIWNFMLEKDLSKSTIAYVGVDNIFNYRDDDRAYQDRLYRIGVNIKLGGDTMAEAAEKEKKQERKETAKKMPVPEPKKTPVYSPADWFLKKSSDKNAGRKKGDIDFLGDYRIRSNMHGGQDNVYMTYTSTGQADDGAAKNYQDTSNHGMEQRLRVGMDAQLGENTNLIVEGSTGGIDTRYSTSDKKRLDNVWLERAELNQKTKKWDFTIGRLTERMGVTGYWFGKEYTGIRTTWTDTKTQVRLGYGDFSKTTGISDSAYSHKEKSLFYRSPTLAELMGITVGVNGDANGGQPTQYPEGMDTDAWKTLPVDFITKFNHAGEGLTDKTEIARNRLKVLQELNQYLIDVSDAYPNDSVGGYGGNWYKNVFLIYKDHNQRIPGYPTVNSNYEEIDPNNDWTGTDSSQYNHHMTIKLSINGNEAANTSVYIENLRQYGLEDQSWGDMLDYEHGQQNVDTYIKSLYNAIVKSYESVGKNVSFISDSGTVLDEQGAKDALLAEFAGVGKAATGTRNGKGVLDSFFYKLRFLLDPFNGSPVPIGSLPVSVRVIGNILMRDSIPAIDRAAFIQVRHKVDDDLGLSAWYLRSSGDGFHKIGMVENGDSWKRYNQEMKVADVFGLGVQYKVGSSYVSFDWGVNRSDTGRYFHGGRDEYGKYNGDGSSPKFWVARIDVGHSDTEKIGSWNAFADYKYFEHGSFFGGNGTEGIPDRYLDGIRSFTLGVGYVPVRNLLLEAFYTFGAKSTEQRDTLYGPETFTLGDYTRIQMTYKF